MTPTATAVTDQHLRRDLVAAATMVAQTVVASSANSVDREARFPQEAVDALRKQRLLGAMIPRAFGGGGASLAEVGLIIELLAAQCASTAMIYAMHQIQVACLVNHGTTPELHDYLRLVAGNELLLASATTEIGVGGDVRTSLCSLDETADGYSLTKEAGVISYGNYADGILATARRNSSAANSDQVIVAIPARDYELEPRGTWDTLGFRGTCSLGFLLQAHVDAGCVIPASYAEVSSRTMLPISHITWAHVWLGIAEGAMIKARASLRISARKTPGETPPGALRVAEALTILHQFRSLVHGAVRDYEAALQSPNSLDSMGFAIQMNNLKLSSSTLVVDVVSRALNICGIAGYREDSPFSLGRALRDAHGAALMVNNDRIYKTTAQMLLIAKDV